ncbi:hypothetical protein M406DRAFT_66406 [Cryphonectria parasitica EP155]|uniref:BRCT domain-containing protein n=1 Tax=Cryphonectria parasitica (strain ATCC 38755 / EP155) TaxID=660469 RepID=A0A9P4YAU0_CRYP1|nr:uncharacterized protein M406DRAFT_66406 [Cryphonectria parasitica EP155]KAF3769951.1 hypothetical protein M406DRAFT_66406 [Cryphonectria parasitica EP155]
MRSLKSIVILIVGNLGEDAFVTADWSNPQKLATEIKRAGMRQVDHLCKQVTHLVVSRRAFKDKAPEVRKVLAMRPSKRKPAIVTWDWLDDVIADKKYYGHYDVYHPGKPRDINAINAKRCKKVKVTKDEAFPEGEDATASHQTDQQTSRKGSQQNPKPSTPAKKEETTTAVHLAAKSVSGGSFKKTTEVPQIQETTEKSIDKHIDQFKSAPEEKKNKREEEAGEKKAVSSGKTSPQKHTSVGLGPHVLDRKTPSEREASLAPVKKVLDVEDFESLQAWVVAAALRPFKDDKDQFQYCIELKNGDSRWMLKLETSTSHSVKKMYRVWAGLYDTSPRARCQQTRGPTRDFQEAMDHFKTFFQRKSGYRWDERLLRAGKDQPEWHYQAPAEGKPTGTVPPEYTPGHPKCVKVEKLAPLNLHGLICRTKEDAANNPQHPMEAKKDDTSSVLQRKRKADDELRAESSVPSFKWMKHSRHDE